ncbi:CsbD family protein [Rhodoblastus sp.]|uniref:CsbD family protein n=1 Tax=Rhodoblastus sp. TaxID=1962975 RepID=UPI0025DEBB8F|nr:CsbD family protein [Rhodoblastus sp.]
MSSTTDKIRGFANQIAGKAKKAVGNAADDDKLRVEGAAQEAKGEVQQASGEAKDAIKKFIDG